MPEKIEAGNLSGQTDISTVQADLAAAGYNDSNRYYVVFEDFDGTATASAVGCSPGANCIATADEWDSGTLAHELFHALGADHTYTDETGATSVTDVMISQYNDWQLDQNFNGYYDPSELSATFNIYFYPDTRKVNIAGNPVFTTPVCCDVGYSNDLLTAQERTIEADAPWSSPTGFTVSGGGWFQVTPPGPTGTVSARYYDGRRSLTMNVQSHAAGFVSVNRKVPVTAGTRYQYYVRLATGTSGNLQLQLSWYNASNVLLSNSTSSSFALTTNWKEYAHSAVAPAGATQAMVRVVSPAGQTFSYVMDALQLMACNNGATTDGCRLVEP